MCPPTLLQGSSLCVSALKLYLTRASPSRVTDCVAGWAEGRGSSVEPKAKRKWLAVGVAVVGFVAV